MHDETNNTDDKVCETTQSEASDTLNEERDDLNTNLNTNMTQPRYNNIKLLKENRYTLMIDINEAKMM